MSFLSGHPAAPQSARSGKPGSSGSPAASHLTEARTAFQRGSEALKRGNLQLARSQFARSVQLAPAVAAGHSALGAVLLALGQDRQAVAELVQARRSDPGDLQAAVNLGVAYCRLGQFPASVENFRLATVGPSGVLSLTPEETVCLAGALSATGDLAGARHEIDVALAASPSSPVLHDALGSLLAQAQQFDLAFSEFQRALALDPNYAPAHFHLGSVALAQSQPKAAIAELSVAHRLAPEDVDIAVHLGRALEADAQDAAAIDVLREALKRQPGSSSAQYALGLALQAAGNVKEALPLLAAAVSAHPDDSEMLTNYALAMVQSGDARRAIPLYEHAAAAGGDNSTLREDLGVAFLQLSDLDRAIEQFRKGLEMDSANPHLHYDLGLGFKLKDNSEAAIGEFRQAEALDPNLPDPPYTLGVLYMQLGKLTEAQTELERAVALRADSGEAWSLLGNVYRQSEQPEKAKGALLRAVELLPDQPGPHITLASLLAAGGDNAGAAEERKTAADLSRVAYSRQRASFALESGRTLLKRGQAADAITQLRTAIAADPRSGEAHLLLGDALSQQGRQADAAVERKLARELGAGTTQPPHQTINPSTNASPKQHPVP